MTIRLLATKFHLPPWRPAAVPRPRLFTLLNTGLHEARKLTLISAPAGYGKTTLVTGWLHSLADRDLRPAWLSLDSADNDPARFFAYFLAAFQQADSTLGATVQPLLSLPQLPPVDVLLDELINELAGIEGRILLTLDDYHAITHPQIHAGLEYFLDHQPAGVHLVFTTREDPPLPLPRLRARGQMTEVRLRDLRFTPEEAARFFDLTLKLTLPAATLQALDERTEGWATGLQLAALALQHQPDPQRFVKTFRGSHRYILDYLAEEVVRQQDEATRRFLTQTSVLERFNAAACCALTGQADAQAVIGRLEGANLFIVPLDDERAWYRYHHLFSDYLRTLLSPAEQSELNRKAAAWHAENDLLVEAVQYALASADLDFAAGVIERALSDDATWSQGNLALLLSWLAALPPDVLQARPRLSVNASRLLYLSGRFEQAEKCLDAAEQALQPQPATSEKGELLALAALYRGSLASVRGDFETALERTRFAQQRIPHDNHLAHARGYFSLGLAHEVADQIEPAVENYLQSAAEARAAGVLFLGIHALCAAAQAQIQQGRLTQAEATCRAAIQQAGGLRIPPLGLAEIILGGIALERNDQAAAGRYLHAGVALARQGGLMDDAVLGLAHLSHLYAVQGELEPAYRILQEAVAVLQAYGVERMALLAAAYQARLHLFSGQKRVAVQWAAEYRHARGEVRHEFAELTLVRVLLVSGDLDELPGILHPILEAANAAGRMQTSLETMLLLGLYHQARKDTPAALEWLGQALRLAAPEGYARLFLDEGQPLLDLMPKARPFAPELVDALLGTPGPESELHPAPGDALIDPLSEQELRVLRLIVAGKSNQEIADELFISVGTAKWHVHNILQKLGVNTRAQAIARSHELGLR